MSAGKELNNESSVVPTLHAFIGRAIRKTYDVGEKVIIGYTPVDLRPIFHFETSGNASSNFPIPYSAKMDRYDINERSKPFIDTSLPVGIKTKIIVREGRKTDTAIYTYGISYAGKVRFGEEIDPHVTSLTACAGSYSLSVMDIGV